MVRSRWGLKIKPIVKSGSRRAARLGALSTRRWHLAVSCRWFHGDDKKSQSRTLCPPMTRSRISIRNGVPVIYDAATFPRRAAFANAVHHTRERFLRESRAWCATHPELAMAILDHSIGVVEDRSDSLPLQEDRRPTARSSSDCSIVLTSIFSSVSSGPKWDLKVDIVVFCDSIAAGIMTGRL